MRLFEDFFDDMETDDVINDEASFDENDENASGYTYKLDICIAGITVKYRKDRDTLLKQLHKFDKILKQILTYNYFITDCDDAFEYSLLDNKWNSTYRYNYLKPEHFEYDGLKFYNDPKVLEDDRHIYEVSQFNVRINMNLSQNPKNMFVFIKCIGDTIPNVAKICFPATNPAKVFHFSIKNFRTGKTFGCAAQKLIDICNMKNTKPVMKTCYDFYRYLFNKSNHEFVDKYFKKTKYSVYCLDIIKALNVNVNDIYVDEDDKSIRIEIPEGVKCKPYIYGLNNIINNSSKYFSLTVNGSIHIDVWTNNIDTIINALYPNVNTLTMNIHHNKSIGNIDLSRLYINNFKATYKPVYRYAWSRKEPVYNPPIIFNPSSKPKICKIIDNSHKTV